MFALLGPAPQNLLNPQTKLLPTSWLVCCVSFFAKIQLELPDSRAGIKQPAMGPLVDWRDCASGVNLQGNVSANAANCSAGANCSSGAANPPTLRGKSSAAKRSPYEVRLDGLHAMKSVNTHFSCLGRMDIMTSCEVCPDTLLHMKCVRTLFCVS